MLPTPELDPATVELFERARQLKRTLDSTRSSRRDVLRVLRRMPEFASRVERLAAPMGLPRRRGAVLESAVALLGHARVAKLLVEYLAEQVPHLERSA